MLGVQTIAHTWIDLYRSQVVVQVLLAIPDTKPNNITRRCIVKVVRTL